MALGIQTMLHTFKNTVADNGEVWVSGVQWTTRSTTGATSFTSLAKVTDASVALGRQPPQQLSDALRRGKVKVDGTHEKEGYPLHKPWRDIHPDYRRGKTRSSAEWGG
jgi:5-enolpyruvylshikimate-3-phosphate synthase